MQSKVCILGSTVAVGSQKDLNDLPSWKVFEDSFYTAHDLSRPIYLHWVQLSLLCCKDLLMILEGFSLHYGDGQSRKKAGQTHGSTHPSRRNKAKRTSSEMENDGRPPDSNEALTAAAEASKAAKRAKIKADNDKRKEDEAAVRKAIAAEKKIAAAARKAAAKRVGHPLLYMQKALHCDGLRLYRDGVISVIPVEWKSIMLV